MKNKTWNLHDIFFVVSWLAVTFGIPLIVFLSVPSEESIYWYSHNWLHMILFNRWSKLFITLLSFIWIFFSTNAFLDKYEKHSATKLQSFQTELSMDSIAKENDSLHNEIKNLSESLASQKRTVDSLRDENERLHSEINYLKKENLSCSFTIDCQKSAIAFNARTERYLRRKLAQLKKSDFLYYQYKAKYLRLRKCYIKMAFRFPFESFRENFGYPTIAEIVQNTDVNAFLARASISKTTTNNNPASVNNMVYKYDPPSYTFRQFSHSNRYFREETDVHPWDEYYENIGDDERDENNYFESERAFDDISSDEILYDPI